MGQQQLLLLVLGIVIVGLAVVVGMQAFSENIKKANSDALVNDAVRIASEAQAWELKPSAFGGGADGGAIFTGLTLEKLGYEVDADGDYTNLNGTFSLAVTGGTNFVITATNADNDNQVTVTATGTGHDTITTVVSAIDEE